MAQHPEQYRRQTEATLTALENQFGRLRGNAAEVTKPQGWAATIGDTAFYDKGLTIPEWQSIGCAVNFVADGNISVVSIGCSMSRAYGYSTLHYEIVDSAGKVVVARDRKRLASTNYSAASLSQTAVGRVFAHTLRPGVYTAQLLVRTEHANSTNWDATLNIYSASISVRTY